MDSWKKNIRREYIVPCLIIGIIFTVSLVFHELKFFTEYPIIYSMNENIGKGSFALCIFLFFLVINLSYLMND